LGRRFARGACELAKDATLGRRFARRACEHAKDAHPGGRFARGACELAKDATLGRRFARGACQHAMDAHPGGHFARGACGLTKDAPWVVGSLAVRAKARGRAWPMVSSLVVRAAAPRTPTAVVTSRVVRARAPSRPSPEVGSHVARANQPAKRAKRTFLGRGARCTSRKPTGQALVRAFARTTSGTRHATRRVSLSPTACRYIGWRGARRPRPVRRSFIYRERTHGRAHHCARLLHISAHRHIGSPAHRLTGTSAQRPGQRARGPAVMFTDASCIDTAASCRRRQVMYRHGHVMCRHGHVMCRHGHVMYRHGHVMYRQRREPRSGREPSTPTGGRIGRAVEPGLLQLTSSRVDDRPRRGRGPA